MMIIMNVNASPQEIKDVRSWIESNGLGTHLSDGAERTVIGIVGDIRPMHTEQVMHFPGVDRVVPISRPYKLSSREFHSADSKFSVRGLNFGGEEIHIFAGPCSVESREQIIKAAHEVRLAGAHALRGGAFKPRTSPYSFQGLGEEGLAYLAEAREVTGLPIVTEVMSSDQVTLIAQYADILQIGARNMQNFMLLKKVGESGMPVLLKRGMGAKIDDLLMAAEYILAQGNQKVILCERGIRTFETQTRNTTDINAIPVLKSLTHLPVILDPSHSTGHWEYVAAISRAGIAAGADGLMIEVHPHPSQALSDGGQSLKPARFADLVRQVKAIATAVERPVAAQPELVHASS